MICVTACSTSTQVAAEMFKLNQWEFCLSLRKMELQSNFKQRQPSLTIVVFTCTHSFPSICHPESIHVRWDKLGFYLVIHFCVQTKRDCNTQHESTLKEPMRDYFYGKTRSFIRLDIVVAQFRGRTGGKLFLSFLRIAHFSSWRAVCTITYP